MESKLIESLLNQGGFAVAAAIVLYVSHKIHQYWTKQYRSDAEHWVLVAQKIDTRAAEQNTMLLGVIRDHAQSAQHLADQTGHLAAQLENLLDYRVCPYQVGPNSDPGSPAKRRSLP